MENIRLVRMRRSLPAISNQQGVQQGWSQKSGEMGEERRGFGCSPSSIEFPAVMESIEGFEEGTR